MNENTRNMIIGVALGAVSGALVGLFYTRMRPADDASGARAEQEDLGWPQILRLGFMVLGTVRAIVGMA